MEKSDEKNEDHPKTVKDWHLSELIKMGPFKLARLVLELKADIKRKNVEIEFRGQKISKLQKRMETWGELMEDKNPYNPDATGVDKLVWILSNASKIMSTSQFKDQFSRLEPYRVLAWDKKMSAIDKYLGTALKSKRIIRYHLKGSGYFYGLPEWFDENGNLQKQYFT